MNLIIDCTTTQDQLKHHGVGHYTLKLVETMVKNNPDDQFFLLLFDGDSTLKDATLTAKNVEVVRIGKFRVSGYKNWLWYKLQFEPAIKALLQRYPDAKYLCPYFWKYYPATLMPTYVTIHDLAFPVFNAYSEQSPLHNLGRRVQYWDAMSGLKKCAGVFTDSDYTRKELLRLMPRLDSMKVMTTLLGIDIDLAGLKKAKPKQESVLMKYLSEAILEAGYFIYMGGTMTKNKNTKGVINGFIEFARRFNEEAPKSQLPYMIVAGRAFENVDFGVGHVQKVGWYEDEDKAILLGNSLGFIHLSTYEGFGLAVAEAMQCGVPVIAHNGSSYTEVVGDAGLLVDGLNENDVADALMKLWKDRKFAKELGRKGQERAELFKWDDTARKTINLMRSKI